MIKMYYLNILSFEFNALYNCLRIFSHWANDKLGANQITNDEFGGEPEASL